MICQALVTRRSCAPEGGGRGTIFIPPPPPKNPVMVFPTVSPTNDPDILGNVEPEPGLTHPSSVREMKFNFFISTQKKTSGIAHLGMVEPFWP
jgi:hypothetical protein